jgi:hypothetical protein
MRPFRTYGVAPLVFFAAIALGDALVRTWFPSQVRLSDNFSSTFVETEIDRLKGRAGTTVFLGDSVLWGYRLRPDETVPALLSSDGMREINLAYEGGSPVNTYAVLKVLLANGVRPQRVVFNVNLKAFNAADSAYSRVHPSIWPLAEPLMPSADTALISPPPSFEGLDARLDRAVARVWKLYAMRSDLREMLFGDVDAAHALHDLLEIASGEKARSDAEHVPTAERFEGTYDLAPLDETNVSVHFLERVADTLRDARVPAVAILTPTNHALLHEYVDTPEYRKNLAYVRHVLADRGVRVVDLDAAFGARDFLDNDHLTAAASRTFAHTLASALGAR